MNAVASVPQIQKSLSSYFIRTALKNSSIAFYVKEEAEWICFKWKPSQRRYATSRIFIPM